MTTESNNDHSKKASNHRDVKNLRYLVLIGILSLGRSAWDIIETDRARELAPIIFFLSGIFFLQHFILRRELIANNLRNEEQ